MTTENRDLASRISFQDLRTVLLIQTVSVQENMIRLNNALQEATGQPQVNGMGIPDEMQSLINLCVSEIIAVKLLEALQTNS